MMAIIRSADLIEGNGEIPAALLRSCISEHRKGNNRINRLEEYYKGEQDILKRDLGGEDKNLPNNKLVANHAKYITDVAVGYFAGDPVKYGGDGIDALTNAYKATDVVSHDAEMAKDLSMFGTARELYFMSRESVPKVTCIDLRQIFLVVDDSVEYRSLFGVHYYERRDIENNVTGWTVNVYTDSKMYQYKPTAVETNDYGEAQVTDHYFKAVPIVEFWNNEEQQGDYEQQISLINAYNVLASDRVNDKEQFVDAILKLVGASLGDDEAEAGKAIRLLKKYKVLELPGGVDADASWLTKTLNEADTEVLRDAIKSDIHEFSMVPNLTDSNFAANASGVAMKYKLFGLEQLAKTKERYFIQGLRERMKVFANILSVKAQTVNVQNVTITMTRSLPSNDVETASMIVQLTDHVSEETLISQLSFVDDPAKEIAAVNAQKEADIKRQQEAFSVPVGGDGGDANTE
ncbi:phage portal protein [Cohnella sp. GCM10020058]|uniref:phage portal protein n=1 Tax=Cohnella sp. GCM10020058 TaxID=3317330 RepID=UPI0036369F23